MISSEVQRTLVKSPPELWAELSDQDALARHLGAFGEIRITKVDHEKAVEWEAERASGSVRIKASGWGTRVTLSASRELAIEADEAPAAEPVAEAAVAEPPVAEPPEVEAPVAEAPMEEAPTAELNDAELNDAEPPVLEVPAPDAHADEAQAAEAAAEEAKVADTPAPAAEEQAPKRRGFFARLFGLGRRESERRHAAAPAGAGEPGPDLEAVRAAASEALTAALADAREPAATTEQPGDAQAAHEAAPARVAQTVDAPDAGDGAVVPMAPEPASTAAEADAPAPEADAPAEGTRAAGPEVAATGPEAAAAALAAIRASAAAGGEIALPYGNSEEPDAGAPTPRDIGAELRAAEEAAVEEIVAVLTGVLDRLGAAHHRPFSRS